MIGAAAYALLIAACVALTAWLAERILASLRRPRRIAWLAALAASLVVPAWNLVGALPGQSPLEIPAPPAAAPAVGVSKRAIARSAPNAIRSDTEERASPVPQPPPRRLWTRKLIWRLQFAFGIAWALLTAGLLARLFLTSRQLIQRGREWPVRLLDEVEVGVSEDLGPAVLGILRPRIIVPRWFEQEPPGRRALVLAHEREHLAAHDGRWLLASALLVALFPWNLPLWWQWRRLRLAVEIDCDARVVRRGEAPQAYGSALVEIAARMSPAPRGATGVFERRSQLERRLRIVLASPRRWWRYAAAPLYALTALSALASATFPAPPLNAALGKHNQAHREFLTNLRERAVERSVTARLLANGGPDALAAAAVFMSGPPIPPNARDRYGWLAKAAAKAPNRADLVMMELTYCRAWKLNCDFASLHAKLQRLDPENGAVWLDDLGAAYAARDPTRINAALTEIGNAQRADSDGTRLVPVLYHALRDIGGADFADAYAWSAGNAGAMLNVEPLVALADLCADRGPPDATRTNACRRALLVFEHGDNFLYAAVGSAGATRLWPADSPEGRAARAIHRRTEYLERHAHLPMPSPAYLVLGEANYFERMVMPILRAETEYPREQDAWRAALIASRVTPDTRILF